MRADLVKALRKAADCQQRFGNRTDVPEVDDYWLQVVVLFEKLIEDKCKKKSPKL